MQFQAVSLFTKAGDSTSWDVVNMCCMYQVKNTKPSIELRSAHGLSWDTRISFICRVLDNSTHQIDFVSIQSRHLLFRPSPRAGPPACLTGWPVGLAHRPTHGHGPWISPRAKIYSFIHRFIQFISPLNYSFVELFILSSIVSSIN